MSSCLFSTVAYNSQSYPEFSGEPFVTFQLHVGLLTWAASAGVTTRPRRAGRITARGTSLVVAKRGRRRRQAMLVVSMLKLWRRVVGREANSSQCSLFVASRC